MRNLFVKSLCYIGIGTTGVHVLSQVKERPNFVWFMTEDVSKHYLNLYTGGETGAITSNLKEMAQDGLVFANAYCNAPVSSVARTTLITGCYAPKLGLSFHRKMEEFPMPDSLKMFPSYLRKAGYHTSNASKTDYNCYSDSTAWDIEKGAMGDWRKRIDKSRPFFHVRTYVKTHESQLHFSKKAMTNKPTSHSLAEVSLPPFHPDTELFRYTYATFFDRIQESDHELGMLINMLKEDGELDNTFIFYFGDNGGALPGSKGYTSERGLQVPLVVYVPEKWREKIPISKGKMINGFVSFIDFGPTLLHLAGIEQPTQMDGTPFLGEGITLEQVNNRNEVFGYGNRFDELCAFSRTLREGRFKYARNYLPYHPKSLFSFYRYKQAAFKEWKEMYMNGELNATQSMFFKEQGAEELYDLENDPDETTNLVNDPAFFSELKAMRSRLRDHLEEQNDLGFYPECVLLEKAKYNPVQFGVDNSKTIQQYIELADLILLPYQSVRSRIQLALQSPDPVMRYWAATVCASFGQTAQDLNKELNRLLDDEYAYVRSRAIVALTRMNSINPIHPMQKSLENSKSVAESIMIFNDIAYLKDGGHISSFQLPEQKNEKLCNELQWRLEYLKNENTVKDCTFDVEPN